MADNEGSQSPRNYNKPDRLKASVKAELLRRPATVILVLLGIIIIFAVLGIWFFCPARTLHFVSHEERYDQCIDAERGKSCSAFIPGPTLLKCTCVLEFQLKTDIEGEVTLYYELESFDQTNTTYANSRDDAQLQGNPGQHPAESCGNFSYYDDKPIFPCGEIADSMFNDTFIDLTRTDVEPEITLPVLYTHLLHATPEFKNPPADVLKNFSLPKSWLRDSSGAPLKPWEDNTELKGVENPAFRAWMDTNLKQKPVWRVGDYMALPAGNYSLTINMFYGVNRYNGVRKIILKGVNSDFESRNPTAGIVFMILTVIFGTILIGYYRSVLQNRKKPTTISTGTDGALPANDERRSPLLNRIRNTLSEFRHK